MRSIFVLLAPCISLAWSATAIRRSDGQETKPTYWVYIGTQTKGSASKGIYRAEFDPATGKLTSAIMVAETASPTFVALHPNKKYLYAINAVTSFNGKPSGGVSAFAIDPAKGDLKPLNQESTMTPGGSHLSVDQSGKYLLTANGASASICVLPIRPDGSLGPATSFIKHEGSSINKARQAKPYPHWISPDFNNRFILTVDLGLDKILAYRLDPASGKLSPNDPPAATVELGSGPRHLAFHPAGKFAYTVNEVNSTMSALAYDADKGTLALLQTLPLIPKDFKATNSSAEVEVHPNGKFLYGSNRGYDSIALFHLDAQSGKMTFVSHQREGIKAPRHFAIDPIGAFLIAENQDGNDLVVFRIDTETGSLTPTGNRIEVPMPQCVVFVGRK